jgi:hybrid cluster-associated redox disulfide protein
MKTKKTIKKKLVKKKSIKNKIVEKKAVKNKIANKKEITGKTNINDAFDINPKVGEILFESGIGCFGCAFAPVETIEQGLKAHGLTKKEIDKLLKDMNK